jgi:hypothetical protein
MRPAYSFMADWMFRLRRRPFDSNMPATQPCYGSNDPKLYAYFSHSCVGIAQSQHVQGVDLHALGLLALHMQLLHVNGDTSVSKLLSSLGVPRLVGRGDGLQSPFCKTHYAESSPCARCELAVRYLDASAAEARMNKIHAEIIAKSSCVPLSLFGTNKNDSLSNVEVRAKLAVLTANHKQVAAALRRREARVQVLMQALSTSSKIAKTQGDIRKITTDLKEAQEKGDLCEPETASHAIKCVVQGLALDGHKRTFSHELKHFYSNLLLHGGPQIHEYVADVLEGPSLSTTRRYIRTLKEGELYAWGPERFQLGGKILREMGLGDAPCLLIEDGTATVAHFDVVPYKDKVVLFGASCGPLEFRTVDAVRDFLSTKEVPKVATMFYLYVLVPLVDGAPSIPVAVLLQDGTKGTYNTHTVVSHWRGACTALLDDGVCLVGHCGDGAPPFRAAALQYMLRSPPTSARTFVSFDHALVQCIAPFVNNEFPMFIVLDPLHLYFRLRAFLLDPKRMPVVFGMACSHAKLVTWECVKGSVHSLGLRANDLNASDKQNYEACLRLFGFRNDKSKGVVVEDRTILHAFAGDADYRGLHLFLQFCHRFARIFLIRTLSPSEMLYECGWCLAFIGYWDMSVTHSKKETKKANFLTLETKVDIILLLNGMVLAIKTFSTYHGNIMFTPWRWSSCYAEHTFSALRLGCRSNDNRISALSGLTRVQIMQGMLLANYNSEHAAFVMKNKRGVPQSKQRISEGWNKAPAGHYPNEDEQVRLFGSGADDLVALLKEGLHKEGSGGMTYSAWGTLPDKGTSFGDMAKRHLLTQTRVTCETWDATFLMGADPSASPAVDHSEEIANDAAYSHEDADEYVMRMHPENKVCLGDNSPVNASVLAADTAIRGVAPPLHDDTLLLSEVARTVRSSVRARVQEHIAESSNSRERELCAQAANDARMGECTAVLGEIVAKNEVARLQGHAESTVVQKMHMLLLNEVRGWNGIYKPKQNTRTGDRFLPNLTNRDEWEDDEDVVEDEDYLALMHKSQEKSGPTRKRKQEKAEVRYAIVERCKRLPARAFQNVHVLRVDDPVGRVNVRFMEVVRNNGRPTRTDNKQLMLYLPIISPHGLNTKVECKDIIGVVEMLLPLKTNETGHVVQDANGADVYSDFYILPRKEESAVNKLFRERLGRMECVDRSGRPAKTQRHSEDQSAPSGVGATRAQKGQDRRGNKDGLKGGRHGCNVANTNKKKGALVPKRGRNGK